jgi:superfamily II DNA/RNA helicase
MRASHFCGTRKRAGELAVKLGRMGERTAAMHADRTQSERDRALAGFREGRLRVLVATDVASRGLDIDDIDLVVNYDVPHDPEDYVHRVGRTARAKKTGLAVTFVTRKT